MNKTPTFLLQGTKLTAVKLGESQLRGFLVVLFVKKMHVNYDNQIMVSFLGLCALVSQLRPTDYFAMCIFNNQATDITPGDVLAKFAQTMTFHALAGFLLVDVLRQSLPRSRDSMRLSTIK